MHKRGILVWITVDIQPYRPGNDGRAAVGKRLFGSGGGKKKENEVRLLSGQPCGRALWEEGPRGEVTQIPSAQQDAVLGHADRGPGGTFRGLAGCWQMTNGGRALVMPQVHYKRAPEWCIRWQRNREPMLFKQTLDAGGQHGQWEAPIAARGPRPDGRLGQGFGVSP
jgi:hypothetical protein